MGEPDKQLFGRGENNKLCDKGDIKWRFLP